MANLIAIFWYIIALFNAETETTKNDEVADVINSKSATEEVANFEELNLVEEFDKPKAELWEDETELSID